MHLLINGKRINYEVKGDGQPIIFVHGWGGSISSLQPLADLASNKFRAVTLDLPGFGISDPPGPDWGVGEYSKLLVEFIHKLGLSKVNYFGHSFGGSLGIFITANHPQMIERLILCNSSCKRTGETSSPTKVLKRLSQTCPLCQRLEPIAKKIYYKIFFPQSDILKYPHLEQNFRKIMTQDLSVYLDKISTPTLILWGNMDRETPLFLAHELKEKIKNSNLIIYPGIGHNLPLKHPELVNSDMEKFLC
jgi:pimeloyl-ACP methyl ester carboxylesterase